MDIFGKVFPAAMGKVDQRERGLGGNQVGEDKLTTEGKQGGWERFRMPTGQAVGLLGSGRGTDGALPG